MPDLDNAPLSDDLKSRIRGAWLGQIAGDALGTTLEFRTAANIASEYPDGLRRVVGGGPFRVIPGQVTDDTELALALARTLVSQGASGHAVAQAYVRWYRSGPFDVGMTTSMALRVSEPLDAVRYSSVSSQASLTSQANGSLMRISPLGIFGCGFDPHYLAECARKDSALTHPHPACQEACAAFVRAMAVLINGGSPVDAWLEALRSAFNDDGRTHGIVDSLKLAEAEQPVLDGQHIGWVRYALQNAFYQLLHAQDFEEALVNTVMAGGDTDTNGCIAGALLGAYYGEEGIPEQWRRTILNCETRRGAEYQTTDARELALLLYEKGQRWPRHGQQREFPFAIKSARKPRPSERWPLFKNVSALDDKPSAYARELEIASQIARDAGEMLKAEAQRAGGPRGQGSKMPVDDEIDEMVHKRLKEAFPGDAIQSEEVGYHAGDSGRCWVVDPHDGTRDFLKGHRETSVSIALVEDGEFLTAVVYAPFATDLTSEQGLMVTWRRGATILRNGQKIPIVHAPAQLRAQDCAVTSRRVQGEALETNKEILKPASLRHCSSIATRLAKVAIGDAQVAVSLAPAIQDWDFAAGQALVLAAGGVLVDQDGEPIQWSGLKTVAKSRRAFVAAMNKELAQALARQYRETFHLQTASSDSECADTEGD